MNYVRMLSYLGDKEAPGLIRVIIPYLMLNRYHNILANFDFTMSNSDMYFQNLNLLQVQRIVTPDQCKIIKAIKTLFASKYNFKIFYDIDDLITNVPDFNSTHNYYKENRKSIIEILETGVDYIVCSTHELAKHLGKYNKTKVIENRLFKPIWKKHNHKSFFETGEIPKILWAGSNTHFSNDKNDDFDKSILDYIRETSKRFEWIFLGHKPKELDIDTVTFRRWEPNYFEYPEILRNIDPDIGIALLQNNDFNKCKSNLKALEYVSLDIPGIYSKITPYYQMSCQVSTTDQFIEKIEKLTSDQDYYEKIKNDDCNVLKDNIYWNAEYVDKYIYTYFERKA